MNFNKPRIEKSDDNDRALMCSAHECPNRWSINFDRPLCSAHGRAEFADWSYVTDQELRKFAAKQQEKKPIFRPTHNFSNHQKTKAIKELAALLKAKPDPKAWAHNLKKKEQNGEKLSILQKSMWRAALRES